VTLIQLVYPLFIFGEDERDGFEVKVTLNQLVFLLEEERNGFEVKIVETRVV